MVARPDRSSSSVPARPDWDAYFLPIAEAVSARADCRRRKVGAVVVNDGHRIVGTGYNGVRPGARGCLAGACPRGLLSYEELGAHVDYSTPGQPGYCTSTHAEANALQQAGRDAAGSTVYISCEPCPACRKALFNAGVDRVVWPGGSLDL